MGGRLPSARSAGVPAAALRGLGAALLLAACSAAGGAPPAPPAAGAASTVVPAAAVAVAPTKPPEPARVRITDAQITSAAGSYIAAEKGYFREEGIEVEFIPSGADQVPIVVAD